MPRRQSRLKMETVKEGLTISFPKSSPLRKESPCVIPELLSLGPSAALDDLSLSLGFLIWSHD